MKLVGKLLVLLVLLLGDWRGPSPPNLGPYYSAVMLVDERNVLFSPEAELCDPIGGLGTHVGICLSAIVTLGKLGHCHLKMKYPRGIVKTCFLKIVWRNRKLVW